MKALEIDDSLAEAQGVLANGRLLYEWDWSGTEQACKRAIELNPNYAWGHAIWSDWLFIMERQEEAFVEAQLSVELDPLSASLNFKLAHKLTLIRDYDRALEQAKKALELDPLFVSTHILLAHIYAWTGMYEESFATCEKVEALYGGSPFSKALPSLTLAMAGRTDQAKTILNELRRLPKLDPLSLILLAQTCSIMDLKTEALELLEVAYQERVSLLIYLNVMPTFGNIRSDPRYTDLLRRIGLPQISLPTSPS
jgi:tetratricopeptide (TPR) repeat protein